MDIKDVVMKLVGPVEPSGMTEADNRRFENLKDLCRLVDGLIYEIQEVRRNHISNEFSVKRAGDYAVNYCNETLSCGQCTNKE